jgi:hypothetical protein
MKLTITAGLATVALLPSAFAAAYSTDFDAGYPGFLSDLHNVNGWTISDTTDQFSQITDSNANPADPFTVSQALNLGDASAVTSLPSGSSVSLSHAYTGTIGATQLIFDFIIADSKNGAFSNRDQFGVSISNGGTNVFAVTFVPTAQSATPNSAPVAQWNLFYQIGAQPTVALNLGVLENSQYNFNLDFSPNLGNPLLSDFSLSLTSAVPNTLTDGATGVALNPGLATGEFNVNWAKHLGGNFGSNSIVVDNLSVVPEPSSSLLICLAGLGFISRRKRA